MIDGLTELESLVIGDRSFELDEYNREGSKCLLMNCARLRQIHIGKNSFFWYESFELKNLPSLTVLEMGRASFCNCHWIVVESINDELMMNEIWIDFNLSLLHYGLFMVVTELNQMNW